MAHKKGTGSTRMEEIQIQKDWVLKLMAEKSNCWINLDSQKEVPLSLEIMLGKVKMILFLRSKKE